jgi:N6-L-threonylcarbamoyladenine synthase
MLVLGIETSCDETSASLVEDGVRVRSNAVASSQKAFALLAGVIPEEAARRQVECMVPILDACFREAGVPWGECDAIAVTRGPGLLGSLLVGTVSARILASVWGKPLIGVHHTLGHLSSVWLDAQDALPSLPCLTLSVSGGHTDLWHRLAHTKQVLLGCTKDDAAGEAFDKGASMLGLPYPGGPSVAAAAAKGDAHAFAFPHPLAEDPGCDYSFSGLKTSLRYLIRDLRRKHGLAEDALLPYPLRADVAASYQEALCTHLLERCVRALDLVPEVRELHLVGGVSANTRLRESAGELCVRKGLALRIPRTLGYCTDQAAMIASAGYFLQAETGPAASASFETRASIPLQALEA